MKKEKIEDLSELDLQDYAAIKDRLPNFSAKEVKRLKALFDQARALGKDHHIPFYLHAMATVDGDFASNLISVYKGLLTRLKTERSRPSEYEATGQLGLFHPEAFEEID